MVESTALEMRRTGNRTVGSNPTLSATFHPAATESEPTGGSGVDQPMKRTEPAMDWPQWATWALLAVVVTSIVTIAAAINDIW